MLTRRHLLALGLVPGVTSSMLRRIVDVGCSFQTIASASPELLASLGMRRTAIAAITSLESYLKLADHQIDRASELGARIVQFWDDDYPERLREIYAPPITLYTIGDVNSARESIAIVGTRAATSYGRSVAESYANVIASAGVTVISGLARGIDTFAHLATLEGGGKTVAVVASGLDEISPYPSARLAERIAQHGAVISEYSFGVKAVPAYFPQRNRIISGVARATLVVESDERGGAMITAGFALDQNRDVFAVPGSISSTKSRGPNLLIRSDRARLTQSPEDLLDALGYHIPLSDVAPRGQPAIDLSIFEQRIYDALGSEPRHIDELCDASGLGASEALVSLLGLEFKGLARQMAGKMFLKG